LGSTKKLVLSWEEEEFIKAVYDVTRLLAEYLILPSHRLFFSNDVCLRRHYSFEALTVFLICTL